MLAILVKVVQGSGRWLLASVLFGVACGAYEFIALAGEAEPVRHAVIGLGYGMVLFFAVDRVTGVLASGVVILAGFLGVLLLPW